LKFKTWHQMISKSNEVNSEVHLEDGLASL
jgi:hypothetical protein